MRVAVIERGVLGGDATAAGMGKGELQDAYELYRWFLPLLRMDVVPRSVQLIKLVQEEVGMGSRHVRPPRISP
jgi:dihydrodipicolinate synthase/N-acetylneuraminate lyase